MRFSDFFYMGFINLWRKKVRTILTALAMAVGVAAIVVLISVGIGYDETYRESVEKMGSLTKIDVMPPRKAKGRVALLNDKAVKSIRNLSGVEAVTPVLQVAPYIKSGNYATPVKLYGIEMDAAEYFQLIPLEGKVPTKGTHLSPEIMLTDDIQGSFADPNTWEEVKNPAVLDTLDPLRSNVRLTFDYDALLGQFMEGPDGRAISSGYTYPTKVTGICSHLNNTYSTSAFIEYKTLQRIMKDNIDYMPKSIYEDEEDEDGKNREKMGITYNLLWVKVEDANQVQAVVDVIREAGFQTYSLNDMVESVKKQSRQIQGMLAAIGAVSLLVAGIGTANTMMMAINERTREIGILKVLGSELTDIVKMFLMESAIIGIIGGVLGLAMSYGLQMILPRLLKEMDVRSIIPTWLAVGGVLFAGIIATVSALLPAMQAMRISPQVAIRAE